MLNLINGSNHARKSVNSTYPKVRPLQNFQKLQIKSQFKIFGKQQPNGLYGTARSVNCTSRPEKKSSALFSTVERKILLQLIGKRSFEYFEVFTSHQKNQPQDLFWQILKSSYPKKIGKTASSRIISDYLLARLKHHKDH